MYSNKTLVGIGCSYVFGSLGNDLNPETSHARSWVRKLETIGNFKNSVNLGDPGVSNLRSEKVLFEYLKDNYTKDLVVIFSITDLSRTEFVDVTGGQPKGFLKIGSWMAVTDIGLDSRTRHFIETYYGCFHDDENDVIEINRRVLMIHLMLKSLNIEHYFFEMLCVPGTINKEQFGFKLPLIPFHHHLGPTLNANGFLNYNNLEPEPCGHWDHEGNEFLANYLLEKIKEIRNE